jgi:hypothetical protein
MAVVAVDDDGAPILVAGEPKLPNALHRDGTEGVDGGPGGDGEARDYRLMAKAQAESSTSRVPSAARRTAS